MATVGGGGGCCDGWAARKWNQTSKQTHIMPSSRRKLFLKGRNDDDRGGAGEAWGSVCCRKWLPAESGRETNKRKLTCRRVCVLVTTPVSLAFDDSGSPG